MQLSPEDEADWQHRQPAGGSGKAACKPRDGTPLSRHTGGALSAFCACGQMFPPLELPAAEGVSMVMLYLLKLFTGHDWAQKDGNIIIAYDDMCHLLRFIQKRANLHPKLQSFLDQVGASLSH